MAEDRALKAYQEIPLARVLVDTLAQACGIAVEEGMIRGILSSVVLLDMLDVAADRAQARADAPKVDKIGLDL